MPDGLQRLIALLLSLASMPLLACLAILLKLDSPGPALYRAVRVGQDGHPFVCLKLRTMRVRRAGIDPAVSLGRDPRVTRVGRLLRRTRLDELPQLWNVARGEMRLVGPRPEDPRFVDLTDALHREVFTVRPGIAGLTQLVYADEGTLLDGAPDPERLYREAILPAKLRVDAAYLRHRSPRLDLWILAQTPRAILGGTLRLPRQVAAELAEAGPILAPGPTPPIDRESLHA